MGVRSVPALSPKSIGFQVILFTILNVMTDFMARLLCVISKFESLFFCPYTDVMKCSSGSPLCKGQTRLEKYSRPILMQVSSIQN